MGLVSPSRPLAGATSVLATPNFRVIKTSGHWEYHTGSPAALIVLFH